MGKTLFVLKENQLKYLIKNVLSEQENYSQHMGSTSAVRVSHDALTNSFGLPDGSTHEDYYYSGTTDNILDKSKSGDKSEFLSIFNPATKYTTPGQKEKYMDYFSMDNDAVINRGNKTYSLGPGKVVYATHNGLLALARAMESMNGRPGYLTINIGKETEEDKVNDEMISSNIILDNEKAFDLTSPLNFFQNVLIKIAINPNFYDRMKFDATRMSADRLMSINYAQFVLNSIVSGRRGFLYIENEKVVNNIIEKLKPLGFKTEINFDATQITNELKKLASIPDYNFDNEFNLDKKSKIAAIGNSYQNNLIQIVKQTYIENFKIFVRNYLPKYEKSLFEKIQTITPTMQQLDVIYGLAFKSVSAPGKSSQSTIDIKSGKYRPGS